MNKISYVKASQGTRLPVALGTDDSVIMVRSRLLLVTESDGADLVATLDRAAVVHPEFASKVIAAGSLGMIMFGRAVDALETYARTGVAQAPQVL